MQCTNGKLDPGIYQKKKELSELEALICQPGDADTQLPATDAGTYYYPELGTQHKGQNIK
jgi:hypothetical protein